MKNALTPRISHILVVAVLLVFFPLRPLFSQSQTLSRTDDVLQEKLRDAVKGFRGNVGVYVRNLKTGQTGSINRDSLFPTASMIKVAILCGVMDRIEKGELKYDSVVVYRDSLKYDNGVTGSFKDSTRIPISELIHLMLSISDNTASLWLQALAGGGTSINAWLEKAGYQNTRVNSRTQGREQHRQRFGWGQTTPREMAELLAAIREGGTISPAASERMYRNLGRTYWDGEALSQIPASVHAVSKQGSVDKSKSEVVLVNAPSGDYVFCVITSNQQDTRWVDDNEGYQLIRSVSRLLWRYFEPKSLWFPTRGMERFPE